MGLDLCDFQNQLSGLYDRVARSDFSHSRQIHLFCKYIIVGGFF